MATSLFVNRCWPLPSLFSTQISPPSVPPLFWLLKEVSKVICFPSADHDGESGPPLPTSGVGIVFTLLTVVPWSWMTLMLITGGDPAIPSANASLVPSGDQ